MLLASPSLACTLPPADLAVHPGPDGGWATDAIIVAGTNGLVLEDVRAWERRFGALPTPGEIAFVMRRGDTRVLLCHEGPLAEVDALRPVLVFACTADPLPEDGVVVPGARVFIQDGVAVVWSLTLLGTVEAALERARYLAATVERP